MHGEDRNKRITRTTTTARTAVSRISAARMSHPAATGTGTPRTANRT
jgi:hypothetical protein